MMMPYLRGSSLICIAFWTVLGSAALPQTAQAASMGFRNDTDIALLVQGISVVNGTIRRGPVHILQPGQTAYDLVVAPGNKLVTIADAKQPTRTLFRDTIAAGASDLFFLIQWETPPPPKPDDGSRPKTSKPAPSKVKLVPQDKPPASGKPPPPRR